MASRIATPQQLAFQAKNNVIWSEVFSEYQEVIIGYSQTMERSRLLDLGYEEISSKDIEAEFGIDIDKDIKREWIIVSIAKQFNKSEEALFDNAKIWEDIKVVTMWHKDTSYVISWNYGYMSFVTPIIFEG